ncbi:MAG TPA: DinB family protein [Chloroflexota bacterium]
MADPVSEFEEYRQELLAALGDDDPLEVLRASLEEIPTLAGAATAEQLRRPPAPDEWSAWQVLSHLADSDLMAGTRVRMIVTQDRPLLVGYDQQAWTARFSALDRDVRETVERWRALRRANLRIFESLTPAEWDRVGVHTERGDESARLTVELMAGHDRAHLQQFRAALAAN